MKKTWCYPLPVHRFRGILRSLLSFIILWHLMRFYLICLNFLHASVLALAAKPFCNLKQFSFFLQEIRSVVGIEKRDFFSTGFNKKKLNKFAWAGIGVRWSIKVPRFRYRKTLAKVNRFKTQEKLKGLRTMKLSLNSVRYVLHARIRLMMHTWK